MTRLELFYGAPGGAKSTAIAHIIKELFLSTGKTARVRIGDGSAATYHDMGLVDAGAVELMDYTIREYPISTLEQLAEGAWPADPLDPNSPLIPREKQPKFGNIILDAFEGLAVAGLYIMGDKKGGFAQRASIGERIGGESEIRLIDGEVDKFGKPLPGVRSYGGHTQGHYSQGQLRLANVIERSKMLPGWVIWTSHEREAETQGAKVIGPEGIGQKATPSFLRLFGNTLHFQKADKVVKLPDPHTGQMVNTLDVAYRIYTRDHAHPGGKVFGTYLATTRITHPDMMPLYLESDVPGASILQFYDIIEQSKKKSMEGLVPRQAAPTTPSA